MADFIEYLPVFMLAAGAIFCIFGIFISKTEGRKRELGDEESGPLQKWKEEKTKRLERSMTGITFEQYVGLLFGCPCALAFLAYFLSDNRTLMIMLFILGLFIPETIVRVREITERGKFEDRFVRALAQMAASLHSGNTVEQAVDSVVDCELLHQSIRDQFAVISSKMKLGVPISQAFYEFADSTGSKDAKDVATAITIMTDIGGDAGVAVEKIQKNIEDRLLYRKKRESMMTESKLIAIFADVMPLIILAGTYVMMPGTIESYFENTTMTLIFIAIMVVLLIGTVVVRKMLADKEDAS